MLNNNSIREKIDTIIKDNVDKREHINLEGTFEDIGVSSLCFVRIMVEIEIQFEVEIDDKYYTAEFKNIGEFMDKIIDYLSGGDSHGN
ncbi:hypothetical protein AN1V17_06100 [Vallitalea sediminicola]